MVFRKGLLFALLVPSLFTVTYKKSESIELSRQMKKCGYGHSHTLPLNLFTQARAIEIPKGFTVDVGPFLEPRMQSGFYELMTTTKPVSKKTVISNMKFAGLRAKEGQPMIGFIIRNRNKKAVGIGALLLGKQYAMMLIGG